MPCDIQARIEETRKKLHQSLFLDSEMPDSGNPEDIVLEFMQVIVQLPTWWRVFAGTEFLPPGHSSPLCGMCVAGYLRVVRLMIETGGKDPLETLICPACQKKDCKIHTSVYHFKSGPLLLSIIHGQLDIVKYLISRVGPCILVDGDVGYVGAAAETGDVELVAYLLESGARAETADPMGSAPICAASRRGHLEVVRLLMAAGIDVNKPDEKGETPLAAAATGGSEGSLAVMRALIEAGANLEPPNDDLLSPLHHAAARAGSLAAVKLLIEAGADASRMYHGAWTPLALAAYCGKVEVVQFLATVADINQPCGSIGRTTAANFAAEEGHTAVVRCLIEAGVKVQQADIFGSSLLHNAAKDGHADLVSYLLSVGANKEAVTAKGVSPLQLAAAYGHLEVVQHLVGRSYKAN